MALINRYTGIDTGAMYITGNTLGLSGYLSTIPVLPVTDPITPPGPATHGSIGAFTTVNNTQASPAWPVGTTNDYLENSSTGIVNLPAGSEVLYAELIWSGICVTLDFDVLSSINDAITFTTPTNVHQVAPDPITVSTLITGGTGNTAYVASQNVTSYVQDGGNGSYTVGAVPGALGNSVNAVTGNFTQQNFLGWTLIIAYRNASLVPRNMYIWLDDAFVNSLNSLDIPVTGFQTPLTGTVQGKLFLSSGEGDADIIGDMALFGPNGASLVQMGNPVLSPNANPGTTPNNPMNNFFGSQINGNDGLLDTTGTFGTRNHDAFQGTNIVAGRQGWDITAIDVSSELVNNQTSAVIQLATDGDAYVNNMIAIQIDAQYADLMIDKTIITTPVVAGQQVVFSNVVTNNSNFDAFDVVLDDTVPATVSSPEYSTDGGATWNTWLGSVSLGTVTANATSTVLIRGTVSPSLTGTLTNTASVSSSTFDPDLTNNTSTDTANVTVLSDLSITKTASPTPVIAGQQLQYTLTVTNNGPSDATGVLITDAIPGQLTGVEFSTNGGSTWTTWTGSYLVGGLANGASVSILIRGDVLSSELGSIVNTATVTSTTQDPDFSNNTAVTTTAISSIVDVSITKTGAPNPVENGQFLVYTITVSNAGPSTAQNVLVTDDVPASLLAASYSTDNGVTYNPWSGTLALGAMDPGTSQSFLLRGTVSASALGTISNMAVVSTTSTDSNPNNNTAVAVTTVTSNADLAITKTESKDPVTTGETLQYSITVVNNGPADAADVVVTDILPSTILGGEFSTDGGVTWNPWPVTNTYAIGSLANGASVTFLIRGTVSAAAIGTITNTATVTSTTTDPNPSNNTSVTQTSVITLADLAITKTSSSASFVAGEPMQYTLTITNNGPSNASSVLVTDLIPAQILGTTYSDDGGLTWNLWTGTYSTPSLANGASITLLLEGTVNSAELGDITNVASVSSDTTDPDLSNNTATVSNSITSLADLQITKSNSPDPVIAGNTLTYTLTVDNNGPSVAQGVEVVDILPSALLSAEYSTDGGSTWSTWTGTYNYGSMSDGASFSILLRGTVATNTQLPITNTSTVASTTLDPDEQNNTATTTTQVTASADLSVTKVDLPDPVTAGEAIQYSIVTSNAGPSDAVAVTLTDVIPLSILSPEVSTDGGATWSTWGGTLDLGIMASGTSQTTLIRGTVDPETILDLSNTVVVSSTTPDPNPTNDTATATTVVNGQADLAINKNANFEPFIAGASVGYTIMVTNQGPSAAYDVVITDALPATVTLAEYSINGGIDWLPWIGTLPLLLPLLPNESYAFELRGVLSGIAGSGTLSNTATVTSSTFDPNPVNNTDTENTPVEIQGEISVTKTALPLIAIAGEPIAYTITVENTGISTIPNVVVTDPISTEITNVLYSVDGGAFSAWPGQYTIPALQPLVPVVFVITGDILPDATGSGLQPEILSNTVTVTNDSSIPTVTSTVETPLQYSADLSVTKTDVQDPVTAGERVEYTLTVSNAGPSTATEIVFTDTFPIEVQNRQISIDGGTTWQPYTNPLNLGNLNPGESTTFMLGGTVISSAQGSIINTAVVEAATTDPNPLNNTATETTTLDTSADLAITKTVTAPTVAAGNDVQYTLEIENLGPSDSLGVVITDTFNPLELINQKYSLDGGQNWLLFTDTIALGTIAAGNIVTVLVEATVLSSILSGTVIPNTAIVDSTTFDPNLLNNESTVNITISNIADLVVTKTVDPVDMVAGTGVEYTIMVSNLGPSTAFAAFITDVVPEQVEFPEIYVESTGQWIPFISPYQIGDLAADASLSFSIRGTVQDDVTGNVTNTVTVDSDSFDPDRSNNTASANATITAEADMSIAKTAINSPSVAGEPIYYTIDVVNNGPSVATGVTITDIFPSMIDNVLFSVDGGPFAAWSSPYTFGTMNPGQTITIEIIGDLNEASLGTITNTATVSSNAYDPIPENNTSTDTEQITSSADLMVSKVAVTNPVIAGEEIEYLVTVTNNGPSLAQGVQLVDILAASITGAQFSIDAGSFTVWNGSYSIGSLANGQSMSFTIRGMLDSAASGQLENQASVTSTTPDPDPDNNVAIIDSQIEQQADVGVTKSASPSTVIAGETVIYTITAYNNGPSVALDVDIFDAVPAELSDVQYSVNNGPFIDWTGSYSFGTIGVNESRSLLLRGTVNGSTLADFTNTVTVASSTFDPNPDNDTADALTQVEVLADVAVTKEEIITPAIAGQEVRYSIIVSNLGSSDALNVELEDFLPGVIENAEYSFDGGPFAPWVTPLSIGTLVKNESHSIVISGIVNSSWVGIVQNTATVTTTTYETNTDNNVATVSSTVLALADLSVVKFDSPDPVLAGETLNYQIQIENGGPSDAVGVLLNDTLPVEILDAVYSDDGGINWYPWSTPQDLGVLASGAVVNLIISGTVDTGVTGTLTNTVSVASSTPDPDITNNTSTITTRVNAEADLSITKTSPSATYTAGEPIQYTLSMVNNGPSTAVNAIITDYLPVAVTGGQYSVDGGASWQPWTGTYMIPSFQAGETLELIIEGTIDPAQIGTITNQATVYAETTDPNPLNNEATLDTEITASADVSVTKVDQPDPIAAEEMLQYTIDVYNAGPSASVNILVTDTISIYLLEPQVSLDGGTTWSAWSGTYTIPFIEPGQTRQILIRGRFSPPVQIPSTITNTVIIEPQTPDPNQNNHIATAVTNVTPFEPVVCPPPESYVMLDSQTASGTVTITNPYGYPNVYSILTPPAHGTALISDSTGAWTYNPLPGYIGNDTFIIEASTPRTGMSCTTEISIQVLELSLIIVKDTTVPISTLPGFIPYTVTVTNTTDIPLETAVVTDHVPVNTSVITDSVMLDGSPVPNPDLVAGIEVGPLEVGQTKVLSFNVQIESGAQSGDILYNTADITFGSTLLGQLVTESAASNTVSTRLIDLAADILKGASQDIVVPGGNIEYTLNVTNTGDVPLDPVIVTDLIPEFSTLIDDTTTVDGVPVPDGEYIYTGININGLAIGESKEIKFQVLVDSTAQAGTVIENEASVYYAYTSDGVTVDDEAESNQVYTTVETAELVIIKSADRTGAMIDDTITYMITIENTGELDADNVTVYDPLSLDVVFADNVTLKNGAFDGPYPGNIMDGINIGTVAAHATAILTFDVVVTQVPDDGIITNQANAVYTYQVNGFIPVIDAAAESNPVDVRVYNPHISVTKEANRQNLEVNDKFTYTIVAENDGDILIKDVLYNDDLPEAFLVDDIRVDGVSVGNMLLDIPVGDMDIGDSRTIEVDITVIGLLPDDMIFYNIAMLAGSVQTDPQFPPEVVTAVGMDTVGVRTVEAKVRIQKTADRSMAAVGETVMYELLVTNTGDFALESVLVSDPLSENLQFISGTVQVDGEPRPDDSILSEIEIGPLAIGQQKTIRFAVEVVGAEGGQAVNQATAFITYMASPDGPAKTKKFESNLYILTLYNVHLSIEKTVAQEEANLGDTIHYQVILTNDGEVALDGVVVKDLLPDTLEYDTQSFMLNGVSINNTDVKQGVMIGMLDVGATARIEYSAVVIKSSCSGNITNHAYATYRYILPSGTSGEGITEKVSVTVISNNALFRQISIDYVGKIPSCKPCICNVETVATNTGTLCTYVIDTMKGISYDGQRLTGRKLIVRGSLCVAITYTEKDECGPMQSVRFEIPVNNFIILPEDTDPRRTIEAQVEVETIECNLLDGSTVMIHVLLLIKANS